MALASTRESGRVEHSSSELCAYVNVINQLNAAELRTLVHQGYLTPSRIRTTTPLSFTTSLTLTSTFTLRQ